MSIAERGAPPAVTAGDVVVGHLADQLASLREQEPLVRVAAEDAVHRMRVACRRARSALATYAPLFHPGAGDRLREELRWLGEVLGEARDAEVLRERLAPGPTEVSGAPEAGDRIGAVLDERHATGLADARAALDSLRYAALLESLAELVTDPPCSVRAGRPADRELARLVLRDWARLRGRAERAGRTEAGPAHDAALHEVRKAAKRLRYAAEAAAEVLGPPAVRLAEAGEGVQEALGEHHDSVVARDLLVALRAAGEHEQDLLDLLGDREAARAGEAERAFAQAWAALPRRHRSRWLRGAGGGPQRTTN